MDRRASDKKALPKITGKTRGLLLQPSKMGHYPWVTFLISIYRYEDDYGKPESINDRYLLKIAEGPGGVVGWHQIYQETAREPQQLVQKANKWLKKRIENDPELGQVPKWVKKVN